MPPKEPVRLEHTEQVLAAARREHERLAEQREQGKASIRGIGHDYHFVDLERGVRRNGHLIASDIQGHIEQIRTVAQQEALSQSCLERINKAERVVPKMQATIAFVSRYVGQQVAQLDLTPPASFAMHAKLIPRTTSIAWPGLAPSVMATPFANSPSGSVPRWLSLAAS